jgi:hypothetical protein
MTLFLLAGLLLADVDLAKLPRKITPPKDSKAPKYCCLVFGERAERVVWVALAGEALFIDRNSDGDFDDAEEKIAAKKSAEGITSTYLAGDLAIPKLDPAELTVAVTHLPQENGGDTYQVSARIRREGAPSADSDGRFWCYAREDDAGPLKFVEKIEAAPILHFAGPWTLAAQDKYKIARGRSIEMFLCIGTPGVGPGSYISVGTQTGAIKSAIPAIRFLSGGPSVRLMHRC